MRLSSLWDFEGSETGEPPFMPLTFCRRLKKAGFDVDQSLLDNIYRLPYQ